MRAHNCKINARAEIYGPTPGPRFNWVSQKQKIICWDFKKKNRKNEGISQKKPFSFILVVNLEKNICIPPQKFYCFIILLFSKFSKENMFEKEQKTFSTNENNKMADLIIRMKKSFFFWGGEGEFFLFMVYFKNNSQKWSMMFFFRNIMKHKIWKL